MLYSTLIGPERWKAFLQSLRTLRNKQETKLRRPQDRRQNADNQQNYESEVNSIRAEYFLNSEKETGIQVRFRVPRVSV